LRLTGFVALAHEMIEQIILSFRESDSSYLRRARAHANV